MTEDEYFNDLDASDGIIGEWQECETCNGEGTIDETLGGEATSDREARCPDCDGDMGRYIEAV